ncbi:MAG: glutamate racemase [Nevskiales bacterium]
MMEVDGSGPIGIFDSGVGGLSVWREIVKLLPQENTIYFADQAHVPYGPRGETEIRHFCDRITRFLQTKACKAVVVACNTASAAALKYLRESFPDLPSVGMEPAVKPAAETTRTKVVGILATPATFQGRLFAATAGRYAYARGVTLISQVCPGLAEQVEAGKLDTADTEQMLRDWLAPMLAARADRVVLACSHYPFVIETIRRIVGPDVNVIDPAPAVARHVQRVLTAAQLLASPDIPAQHRFYTSEAPAGMQRLLLQLVGVAATPLAMRWDSNGELQEMAAERAA